MKPRFFAEGRSLFRNRRGEVVRRRGRDAGQVAVVVAIALPVLVGIVGVTVEAGQLRAAQRRMEIAADAGALAGALQMQYMKSIGSADFSSVPASAQTDTSKNQFTHGTDGVTVTVNRPPTTGSYTATASAVEVIVAQNQPAYFLRLLGIGPTPVRARAVAAMWSGPNCIYALDTASTSGALKLTPGGGYSINAACGVVVNSKASDAIKTNGNTLKASTIGVVGNPGYSGTPAPSPIPTSGINAVSDPLAYVTAPALVGGACIADPNITSGAKTLPDGTYCSITIGDKSNPCSSCANPPNVTFSTGEYILKGDFKVYDPGGCTTAACGNSPKGLGKDPTKQATDNVYYPSIRGTGVTFYITQDGKGVYGDVDIGGGMSHWTNSRLSAPTNGPYAGILFFQDRLNKTGAKQTLSFGVDPGCTNPTGFEGALYFPNAPLKIANSSSCAGATFPKYTIIVAKTIDFYRDYGNFVSLGYDTSGLSGGSPIQKAVLVE